MKNFGHLNRAKTSIIQKQATINALVPIAGIKEADINESEEMTEDYSVMAKKATVNSNYFSQNSLRQKDIADEAENQIANDDMEGPYFCIKHPDTGSEIKNVRKRISMSQNYLEKSIETINKMKDKQIKLIQDEFTKIINIVEERMNKQMNMFASRLQELKNVTDSIEKIELNYGEVASFIEENPIINMLEKISEIEGFLNDSIESLNKTKEFKVHDLSITEKIKPLRAFLGHLFQSQLPPKALPMNK